MVTLDTLTSSATLLSRCWVPPALWSTLVLSAMLSGQPPPRKAAKSVTAPVAVNATAPPPVAPLPQALVVPQLSGSTVPSLPPDQRNRIYFDVEDSEPPDPLLPRAQVILRNFLTLLHLISSGIG